MSPCPGQVGDGGATQADVHSPSPLLHAQKGVVRGSSPCSRRRAPGGCGIAGLVGALRGEQARRGLYPGSTGGRSAGFQSEPSARVFGPNSRNRPSGEIQTPTGHGPYPIGFALEPIGSGLSPIGSGPPGRWGCTIPAPGCPVSDRVWTIGGPVWSIAAAAMPHRRSRMRRSRSVVRCSRSALRHTRPGTSHRGLGLLDPGRRTAPFPVGFALFPARDVHGGAGEGTDRGRECGAAGSAGSFAEPRLHAA